ncbi:MAG TPA: aspartate kinase, partial [Myxococcales bacterium]|nr:aspartate kinase [Myxococcales bacterium]
MALIVQKYGGTSVGDIDRIKNVARRCIDAQKAGHDVVVVVSAMSGETNRLLKLVSQVTER